MKLRPLILCCLLSLHPGLLLCQEEAPQEKIRLEEAPQEKIRQKEVRQKKIRQKEVRQEEAPGLRDSIEDILALTDETDPDAMPEELEELRESPVRINSGDPKEISRLFFLTDFQVMVLVDHVNRNGSVVTIYELALLPAFDRGTVLLMAPYISLEPTASATRRSYGSTMVTLTSSVRFSGTDDDNEGARSLMKVKHEYGRLTLGLTAENDPGEPFTFRGAPGTDFLSGYIQYEGKGFVNRIIAGDFAVRAGEGLLFNSNRWMGSWLSSPSFMSGRSVSSPYTSSGEDSFFRGISLTLGSMNAGAVLFASANRIDARLRFSDDSTVAGVSNLVSGGIHSTESQLEARNTLTETVAGLRLIAGAEKVRGGVTAAVTWFSLPFVPDMTKPENIHAFAGNSLLNVAADVRAGTGSVLFFAEGGMSLSTLRASSDNSPGQVTGITDLFSHPGLAVTAGVRAKPAGRVTFNILARHLSPGYHAFHSGPFKAGSGAGNESGISASVHIEAARHLFITAAADHYSIPWPRYRSSSPSCGSRTELKAEYMPRDDLSLRVSYTSSAREYDSPSETGTAASVTRSRHQAGFTAVISPTPALNLTTRASFSLISPSREKGYLLCQDFSYSLYRLPFRIWFRYALCSTGGWDSRLYAWENDLLSSFSVPALYGEMARSYIMLSWKPLDQVEVRVKYGFTHTPHDRVNGLRQEVKGQVRIGF